MRHKLIILSLGFFFLLFISLMSSVNAIGFQSGVSNGQELVWKCNVCNKNEMDDIFGPTWDDSGIFSNLSKGKRMKWNISAVEINQTFLTIHFSIWEWTSETSWGIKDSDSQISYFSNPDQYPSGMNFSQYSSFVPFLFPKPVGDYMGELILSEWYDVDNRVLPTLNIDIKENAISPGTPSRDINIIAIYNDQGILNSYKLYIKGNIVIIDISFKFLPFYVLPTLIGLLSVFVLIIILVIKKRKITSISYTSDSSCDKRSITRIQLKICKCYSKNYRLLEILRLKGV